MCCERCKPHVSFGIDAITIDATLSSMNCWFSQAQAPLPVDNKGYAWNIYKFRHHHINGKSLHNPLNYLGWTTSPPKYKTGFLLPEFFKTNQITPQAVLNGGFVFFSFLSISAEFLKNHSKSQKNHKMKIQFCLTPHE